MLLYGTYILFSWQNIYYILNLLKQQFTWYTDTEDKHENKNVLLPKKWYYEKNVFWVRKKLQNLTGTFHLSWVSLNANYMV